MRWHDGTAQWVMSPLEFIQRLAAPLIDQTLTHPVLQDSAETLEELDMADEAVNAIRQAALSHLSTTPYSFRKVGVRSTLRELIIPFGAAGAILRYDIRSPGLVLVIGVRLQREEDFH